MADGLLAQSAIDRLQSAAWELVLDGESYRHRQRPAISPPATATSKPGDSAFPWPPHYHHPPAAASTSFVLATLRALHVDPAAGGQQQAAIPGKDTPAKTRP